MRQWILVISLLISGIADAKSVRIILDAGHGGQTDLGYATPGFDEKTADLELTKKVQTELEKNDDLEVVLSRIGDYPVAANDRRKTANQYDPSIFISLHLTVYEKEPQVTSYVLKQVTWNQSAILTPIEYVHGKQYKNSVKLAQTFDEEFPENLNHRIVMARYPLAALIGVESTAVLVECACFSLSQKTSTDANYDEFARNIAQGITNFARKVL